MSTRGIQYVLSHYNILNLNQMKNARPYSESPFKLDYELGLAHPPQYAQRFLHLFHYHPCYCTDTLKGLWNAPLT